MFWKDRPSADKRGKIVQMPGGHLVAFDRTPGMEHVELTGFLVDGQRYEGTAPVSLQDGPGEPLDGPVVHSSGLRCPRGLPRPEAAFRLDRPRSVRVLAGLNRQYLPSAERKWIRQFLAVLPVAPPDCAGRLADALSADPPAAWAELRTLINETITLVERYLPEVNTKPLDPEHQWVMTDWARRRWEKVEPYSLMQALGTVSDAAKDSS